MKNTLNINTEFLKGATLMELDGLGESPITEIDIIITKETIAEVWLHWRRWPFNDCQRFKINDSNTLDDLREIIKFELLNITNRIAELEQTSSVSSDPTIERD